MRLLLLIKLLILSSLLSAQMQIHGTITNKNKKALPEVLVSIADTNVSTTTDSSGRYSLVVPKGFFILKIEKKNYVSQQVAIDNEEINVSLTSSLAEIDFGFEQYLNIKVITATRQLTELDKSPSPITIITEAQIQNRGYKTLEEVLQTIPGFYTGHAVAQALVMNRGITQDQNVNYLLLIDGHSQNSISLYGFDQQHIYPFLGNVKQIEIIRGPGSTLWGSDALMGIVNIITKSADDIDKGGKIGGLVLSFDEQIRDHNPTANLQYAKKIGKKADITLSYTGSRSQGDVQAILSPVYNNANQPTPYTKNITYYSDAYRRYPLSHDMYLKSKIYDFSVIARYSDQNASSGFGTAQDGSFIQHRYWKQSFIETKYEKQLTDRWVLDAKLLYDNIFMGFRQDENPYTSAKDSLKQVYADEEGIGTEIMAKYKQNNLTVLSGFKSMYRDCKKSYIIYYEPYRKLNKNHSGGYDFTNAFFSEAIYQGVKNFIFIGGVRLDKNNLRDTMYSLLPRASVIYKLDDNWVFKYMFNTGIMRPTLTYLRDDAVALSNGNPANISYGTTKSQKTYSNDLQVSYASKNLHATGTLFYTVLNDFTTYVGLPKIFYGSLAPITTKGVELEFESEPIKNLTVWGNASYNIAKYKDSTISSSLTDSIYYLHPNAPNSNFLMTDDLFVLGPPRLIWNLGTDINIPNYFIASIHYRGWAEQLTRWGNNGADGIKKLDPEHYVDVNILRRNCFVKNLDFSVYVKNVLNNQNYITGLPHLFSKYYGRAFGASISYRF